MKNLLDNIMGNPMEDVNKLVETASEISEKYRTEVIDDIEDTYWETHCYSY